MLSKARFDTTVLSFCKLGLELLPYFIGCSLTSKNLIRRHCHAFGTIHRQLECGFSGCSCSKFWTVWAGSRDLGPNTENTVKAGNFVTDVSWSTDMSDPRSAAIHSNSPMSVEAPIGMSRPSSRYLLPILDMHPVKILASVMFGLRSL